MDNIMVGVCHRLSGQDEELDEAFLSNWKNSNVHRCMLVLKGDLNHHY